MTGPGFFAVDRALQDRAGAELVAWLRREHPTLRNPGLVVAFYTVLSVAAYKSRHGDGPRAHPDGNAARIGEQFGLGTFTVARYLELLEAAGWIEWKRALNQEADGRVVLLLDLELPLVASKPPRSRLEAASDSLREISPEALREKADTNNQQPQTWTSVSTFEKNPPLARVSARRGSDEPIPLMEAIAAARDALPPRPPMTRAERAAGEWDDAYQHRNGDEP